MSKQRVMPVWCAKFKQSLLIWCLGIVIGLTFKSESNSFELKLLIVLSFIYIAVSNKWYFKQLFESFFKGE